MTIVFRRYFNNSQITAAHSENLMSNKTELHLYNHTM